MFKNLQAMLTNEIGTFSYIKH